MAATTPSPQKEPVVGTMHVYNRPVDYLKVLDLYKTAGMRRLQQGSSTRLYLINDLLPAIQIVPASASCLFVRVEIFQAGGAAIAAPTLELLVISQAAVNFTAPGVPAVDPFSQTPAALLEIMVGAIGATVGAIPYAGLDLITMPGDTLFTQLIESAPILQHTPIVMAVTTSRLEV